MQLRGYLNKDFSITGFGQDEMTFVQEYQATHDILKHYNDLTMRFDPVIQTGILIFYVSLLVY